MFGVPNIEQLPGNDKVRHCDMKPSQFILIPSVKDRWNSTRQSQRRQCAKSTALLRLIDTRTAEQQQTPLAVVYEGEYWKPTDPA